MIRTATFRQSTVTLSGTIVNGILGAVFYLLLAHVLGPASFGLFILAVTIMTLLADITNIGTDTGIVRFVSAHLATNKDKALRVLKLSLEIKIVAGLLVLVVGLLVGPYLSFAIFAKPELTPLLPLVMIGIGGSLLFTFITASLQAFQRFISWSLLNCLMNASRLLIVWMLIANGNLTLGNSLLVYTLSPLIGFVLGLTLLPTRQIVAIGGERQLLSELFSFNGWVALFSMTAAISSRVDTLLVGRLLPVSDVGVYGAANQLITAVPQLVSALGVVFAPKFSSFTNQQMMFAFFKKTQLMVLGLAALAILSLPAVYWFLPLLLGDAYSQVFPIFVVLLISSLIFLISLPVHISIIYYYSKPSLFTWVTAGHLIILLLAGSYLISFYGVMGAAFAHLIGSTFNLLVPAVWLITHKDSKN